MMSPVRLSRLKRLFVGSPLPTAQSRHERLARSTALAVFASDALSSVAYATEEILLVLVLPGPAALSYSIPISVAIAVLIAIVVSSYRQTIRAYPQGGGAYIVSKDTLGVPAGLVAGAALLIDYVLTVAVSVAAGIAALTSAVPALFPYRPWLCVAAVVAVAVATLRGIRESGKIFAAPTYLFIGSLGVLILYGGFGAVFDFLPEAPYQRHPPGLEGVGLFLFLRAFASGCTALTGVEAVSDGGPGFQPPEAPNARIVLTVLGVILTGLAALLLVIFGGDTHALIPLYAVGVFLSFTLSQASMVRRWLRLKEEGWWWRWWLNAIGALVTGLVMITIAATKFTHGAWIVVLLIPTLVAVFVIVHRHYEEVAVQLSLDAFSPPPPMTNTVLVLVGDIHRGVIRAIQYAQTLSPNAKAVFVETDPERTRRLEEKWGKYGMGVPLSVLTSPYRTLLGPLTKYVDHLQNQGENHVVTIVLPEFIPARWWQLGLHNQTAFLIKGAMLFRKNVIVTDVPYHLRH